MHKQVCFVLFIGLLLYSFLFSCTEKKKTNYSIDVTIVNEWLNRKIILPTNLSAKIMGRDTVCNDFFHSKYKILVAIDSAGCTDCKLHLFDWMQLISVIDSTERKHLSFLFIAYQKNFAELELISKRDKFNYPIFYDFENKLQLTNHLPKNHKYRVFLLDEENRVKVIGSPLFNKRILWMYFKTIRNINN